MTQDEIIDKDEVLKMARQAGFHEHDFPFKKFKFVAFAKLVAAKEREECAKECEHTALRMGSEWVAQHCANAIRARGETTLRGEA
jgi:hypothetical protein